MKKKKFEPFNKDVQTHGSYQYTKEDNFSAGIATLRETEELVNLLKKNFSKDTTILDIGCGDGVFTIELLNKFSPKKITGFDPAKEAIKLAQKRYKKSKKLNFDVADIYTIKKSYKKNSYTVGVLRGVLHHLDNPQKAISEMSQVLDKIIVLEPNGYNPLLKVIEKTSPYHIAHQEKSYFPPTLNSWFVKNGFQVKSQKFFRIVPYFGPKPVVNLLNKLEASLEKVPLLNKIYCGSNLIYYSK